MKRLALLLALASSAAVAQSAAVPDLRAAKNAAARAETACSKNTQQAKCKTETDTLLRHAQNAHAIVNPTPTPSPVPTPTPSPTPTPTPPATGYVPSPTLNGASDLVATFPVSEGLVPSWGTGQIPGQYGGGEGAFRLTCGIGHLNYDDALFYPGQPGKAHLHDYWGPTDVNANTTMATLAASTGLSTCNYGTKTLNRSAYWAPALLHADGTVRRADWIAVYYKRPMASAPACDPANPNRKGICVGLPNQIRYVFGWDQFNPDAPVKGAQWGCTGGTGWHKNLDDALNSGCAIGGDLIADLMAPDCWDGKYLDTPGHRSHVAYAGYGDWGYLKCPATHPYVIPQNESKVAWTLTADMLETLADGTKRSRVRLASDHMKVGAKPGETLHSDYMEQWVAEAKRMWLDNCIDKGLSCSGGDLGNGLQLIGANAPSYGWVNPNPRVPVPPRT